MKIKKYLVKSIDEAIPQIKRDLGPDAYILSQKKVVQSGALKISSKEMIEVTAAVDRKKERGSDNISSTLLARKYGAPDTEPRNQQKLVPERVEKKPDLDSLFGNMDVIRNEIDPIREEMKDIKMLLKKGVSGDSEAGKFHGIFLELYLALIEADIDKNIARKLINSLQYQASSDGIKSRDKIVRRLTSFIASMFQESKPLQFTADKRKIVTVVGPTGVGKTTTIAKLSSYFSLMELRKSALITIDGYRIGAEAHLRTYADILNIPFYTVYDAQDMKMRLESLKDYEMVFIDTTGRGASDQEGLDIMKPILDQLPSDEKEVFLVMSATTKSKDLFRIYDSYSMFKPDKLIFSKTDETESLGNLLTLVDRSELPVAYLTTGQKVPEDIEIAYPGRFARMILNDSIKGDHNEPGI